MFRVIGRRLLLLVVVLGLLVLLFKPGQGAASQITERSVTISTAAPSAIATHIFQFTLPTTNSIGSLAFEYCLSPVFAYPCIAPGGVDVNSANLTAQAGNVGFSLDNADTTSNRLVLSRTAAAGLLVPNSYSFDNITNPNTGGQTTYVRITSYASSDGSGPVTDNGATAFAILNIFNVDAYVPPFLNLCVGITVAPDCSSIVGDSLDLGDLSSSRANAGQSQFATATNDPNGYVVYALGTTMTSGNNIITSLSNPTASFPGTPQFGFNLRANLIPGVGQDPIGVGTGIPTANYNIPNRFVFNSGDSIVTSTLPSDYNRMTVSYLVNVPSKQAPGIYSTTVTYVAVVQF